MERLEYDILYLSLDRLPNYIVYGAVNTEPPLKMVVNGCSYIRHALREVRIYGETRLSNQWYTPEYWD